MVCLLHIRKKAKRVKNNRFKVANLLLIITDTPCTYGGKDGDFPKDTKCKQVYSRHNMLTISPISKRVAFDTFQIPSACVCHINEDSEIINFQSYDYQ